MELHVKSRWPSAPEAFGEGKRETGSRLISSLLTFLNIIVFGLVGATLNSAIYLACIRRGGLYISTFVSSLRQLFDGADCDRGRQVDCVHVGVPSCMYWIS